jgi:hypothetical protein
VKKWYAVFKSGNIDGNRTNVNGFCRQSLVKLILLFVLPVSLAQADCGVVAPLKLEISQSLYNLSDCELSKSQVLPGNSFSGITGLKLIKLEQGQAADLKNLKNNGALFRKVGLEANIANFIEENFKKNFLQGKNSKAESNFLVGWLLLAVLVVLLLIDRKPKKVSA